MASCAPAIDDFLDRLVDRHAGGIRQPALNAVAAIAKEARACGIAEPHSADIRREAPVHHHPLGDLSGLLDVGFCAGGHFLRAKYQLFGRSSMAMRTASSARRRLLLIDTVSRSGRRRTMPRARPRGTMVALWTGGESGESVQPEHVPPRARQSGGVPPPTSAGIGARGPS